VPYARRRHHSLGGLRRRENMQGANIAIAVAGVLGVMLARRSG
jgi:hypothetical protein